MTTAPQRHARLDRRAFILLLLCCMFWGLQQVLIKSTVAEVPPLWQATLRFWGATALLLVWCRWRGVPLWARDGTLRGGLWAGLFFAGELVCIYLGMQHTTASRLTVFLYLSPLFVALLVPLWVPSEKLSRVQWLGLVLAFASVALAFAQGFSQSSAAQFKGDALALMAGLLWALTTVMIRSSALAQSSAEKILFYQVAVTAALMPLLSLAWGETWGWAYSAQAWASIAAQSVVGAFASYLVWMWLLRHYPATQTSAFVFLTPVFALLFGVTGLGEPISAGLLLALAGVASGIVLVSRWR